MNQTFRTAVIITFLCILNLATVYIVMNQRIGKIELELTGAAFEGYKISEISLNKLSDILIKYQNTITFDIKEFNKSLEEQNRFYGIIIGIITLLFSFLSIFITLSISQERSEISKLKNEYVKINKNLNQVVYSSIVALINESAIHLKNFKNNSGEGKYLTFSDIEINSLEVLIYSVKIFVNDVFSSIQEHSLAEKFLDNEIISFRNYILGANIYAKTYLNYNVDSFSDDNEITNAIKNQISLEINENYTNRLFFNLKNKFINK